MWVWGSGLGVPDASGHFAHVGPELLLLPFYHDFIVASIVNLKTARVKLADVFGNHHFSVCSVVLWPSLWSSTFKQPLSAQLIQSLRMSCSNVLYSNS